VYTIANKMILSGRFFPIYAIVVVVVVVVVVVAVVRCWSFSDSAHCSGPGC